MKAILLCAYFCAPLLGQNIPDLTKTEDGKFQVEIAPDSTHYSRLLRSRDLMTWEVVALGPSSTEPYTLADSVLPRPDGFYRVDFVPTNSPKDSDGDGRSDLAELAVNHGLNAADPIPTLDGNIFLASQASYDALSKRDNFPGAQNVKEVKFLITNIRTNPELYFFNINRNQHHYDFATNVLKFPRNYNAFTSATYISAANRQNLAGSLVSHDNYVAPDGTKGIYTLEFWPTDPVAFEWIELAYEIIAKNAPFITRLAYHAPSETQRQLQKVNQAKYDASSIHTIETDDLFSSTTYQPMNQQEAFGRLVVSTGAETLSARDIVIFNNLPNDLTYVSGIITEVPQTPLSHVNLKAQQNDTPNAYIADAANHPDIAPLIGQNIFYRVTAEGFEIRAGTQQEVEDYFESIRPTGSSSPHRDLSETEITPLSEVAFAESDSFGGKAANVAELRRLFPNNAPDGFAIPFYFYHQFMIHNRFYPQV
ncbi:PEP/pyruvate-binding domain-containing protein, partial [Akkermansiaceae bacterium]|nr:PEP/pyruvate-binding domain-containing protein [Akkermansiaceae bacterium]